MKITFYDLAVYTTTTNQISSITVEANYDLDRDDYRFYFDKKDIPQSGAYFTLSFDSSAEISSIFLDNFYGAEIYGSDLTYYYGGSTYSLDVSYSSATTASYHFDLGSAEDTLTFDSETALLDGESWIVSSTGEKKKDYYFYCIGGTASSSQSVVKNVFFLNEIFELETKPDSDQYDFLFNKKTIIHKISNGGIKKSDISSASSIEIELDNISENDYSNLKDLYEKYDSFFIMIDYEEETIPEFGGHLVNVNWYGDFDFDQLYDNYIDNGYNGTLRLSEVPK